MATTIALKRHNNIDNTVNIQTVTIKQKCTFIYHNKTYRKTRK